MLVSLHLPKTAGGSFLTSLKEHYGEELLCDYEDFPINKSNIARNLLAIKGNITTRFSLGYDYRCIHGHFLPLKYRHLKDARFITWMRDPLERLGSHYNYWLRTYNPNDVANLHRRVVEEKWSFEKFCKSHEMRNFYNKFLWGFDIDRFEFIGITEFYDEDMNFFSKNYMGRKLTIYSENVNGSINKKNSYFLDEKFKREIEKIHRIDMDLYQYALELRHKRN